MKSMQNVDVDEFHCERYQAHMLPEQCRAGRAWLNWKQDDLAIASGVGLSTIRDFESGKRKPVAANLATMKAALEKAGIAFVDDGAKGVLFKG